MFGLRQDFVQLLATDPANQILARPDIQVSLACGILLGKQLMYVCDPTHVGTIYAGVDCDQQHTQVMSSRAKMLETAMHFNSKHWCLQTHPVGCLSTPFRGISAGKCWLSLQGDPGDRACLSAAL